MPNEAFEQVDKLLRQELGLNPAQKKIEHCKNPNLPQFSFEWHPHTQKVYRIDLPGHWQDGVWQPASTGSVAKGHVIAEHCLTHAQFLNFAQTFCRAYHLALFHQSKGLLGSYVAQHMKENDSCPVR